MNKPNTKNIDLANLASITEPDEIRESIDRDFGSITDTLTDGVSRRRWLQIMGASLALGGTVGCRYEEEKIAPFAFRPQNRIPGVPEKFASVIDFAGVAQPVLATCYDGRPIKLDGNPEHPCSRGASTAFTQAEILNLYDPDRLRSPMKRGDGELWDEVSMDVFMAAADPGSMTGVAILAEPTSSPSLMRLKGEFEAKGGKWFTFTSIGDDNTRAGTKMAFGTAMRPHYMMDQAKVIVTLDADPLGMEGAGVLNSARFAEGRDADHGKMNRLYSVESQYTITGGSADHRISLPSSKIANFAAALKTAIGSASGTIDEGLPYRDKVLACMASDLVANKGAGIIVAGDKQPPEVHALVHAMNDELGNNGKTVLFTELPDADRVSNLQAISDFATVAKGGSVRTVVVLGGNPVYSAPPELELASAISACENSVHFSQYKNETSLSCNWMGGLAHELETWNDGWAYDGSVCIGQPLIRPLFDGKSSIEFLAALLGNETTDGLAIIQETAGLGGNAWSKAVHDGFIADSAATPAEVSIQAFDAPTDANWNTPWDGSSFEIVFNPSSSVYDGRFANNAWLQELPDFFTKITWDNVAMVSPNTATKMGLKENTHGSTLVTVKVGGKELNLPVHIQPGQADGSIGVALGYGRTQCGRVGGNLVGGITRYAWAADKVGSDVGVLRSAENWFIAPGASLGGTGTSYKLATTQEPWAIDETGRNEIQARMFRDYNKQESDRSALIREGTFASYQEFLSHHPTDHSDHGHSEAKPKRKAGPNGELLVLNNVSFVEEEKHEDDGHGHGHGTPHWPEAFHMHHELFDITPGAREDYRADKVQKDRWGNTLRNRWGMSIDLNKCTGCNSCVIACQSENNIPVVGKSQVWRGREMHWLRIDRYYGDNLYNKEAAETDDKQIVHQPVTCHHCENAPCETVCPVAATVHSSEGLNDMVYNRCIGTRYCGNNCPYKVRRFNYFNYSDAVTLIKYPGADKMPKADRVLQNLMMNPEVTVRSRGVMEKCTYCTQRISNGRIKAKVENREIGPNEIRTACQDACPTQAIKFGDLTVKESEVAQAHANPRSYTMLEELNNHPRTKYLARVRNPHKALVDWDDRHSVRGGAKHDDHAPAAANNAGQQSDQKHGEEPAQATSDH